MATSDVVPMLYSSAPIIAAITTSRPVFDAAVGAQDNPMSEAVERQHLMRFGQAHFPGQAGELDRGFAGSHPCRRHAPRSE